MEYEVAAPEAQALLTLQLSANPTKTVALKLYSPDAAELPLKKGAGNKWTARLPKPGDYGISVLRLSRGSGKSAYKLVVALR